ncbi:hypothetical protein [Oceanobacillus halophilus]|uniref:Uncharacterized protein n=1 Tax=Oceanobacillus halophilus TaxID=930130 RepID=A0A494ZXN7_9BACI|nr:hypothetical protein [Oceanobacillus halophilus]RKQ30888.1 hypothetical protein D8M06_14775 [Oceanobacillus halophilus]
MNNKDERVIQNYQENEKMMILIFAQWCVNHDLNPEKLYAHAYPNQPKNQILTDVLEETIPKNEAEEIADETVLNVLQIFGNDDLAFIVQSEIEKRGRN